MKISFAFLFLCLCVSSCQAGSGMGRGEYANKFTLHGKDSAHWPVVSRCLSAWGETPFRGKDAIRFRVIDSSVKVLGVGDAANDSVETNYPQLILVKPNVNVMSKSIYHLKNPNGWYCFEGQVNVMGKAVIHLACRTHIIGSKGSAVVLGKSTGNAGTTVMGKTVIYRNCKKS